VSGKAGGERRDRDDENRVRAEREPGDDDQNADEWKQAAGGRRRLKLRVLRATHYGYICSIE
jgi:hypothetical protein